MSALVIPISTKSASFSSSSQRPAIEGGAHEPATAMELMNSHFMVSDRDGEIGIYRIEDNGAINFLPPDQFGLLLSNVFVKFDDTPTNGPSKLTPIAKFWLSNRYRRSCRRIVFEPKGDIDPRDYNLWRGYAVAPKPGLQHQRRLLVHIFRVICRRDKMKFKYLMKWLAWTIQNPDRHAEVIVVLKSEAEGSGKSTLGVVMLEIFGRSHGLLVDNKEQLLGNFNAHLETISFVLGEEVLWAGDPKAADALKSRVTASVIPIEAKYRQQRLVTNHLHVMLTTNHEWAIAAGVNARRYFVCDVSDEVAQDKTWFEPLYADLKDGGISEFLHLLLKLKLDKWHPREVPKTQELVEQQVMSAASMEQWLLACAEVDGIIGSYGSKSLGEELSTRDLYNAYVEYTKGSRSRAISMIQFGKRMTEMFGPNRRLKADYSGKRAPGYLIPDAPALRQAVMMRLKATS